MRTSTMTSTTSARGGGLRSCLRPALALCSFLVASLLAAPSARAQLEQTFGGIRVVKKIWLSQSNGEYIDGATAGDDFVLLCGSGGTTDRCLRVDLDDASAPVIEGRTGANAAAGIQVGTAGQTTTILGALSQSITDNSATAWVVKEGANNYLVIDTTNAAEALSYGNATTNPTHGFLGSGLATFSGGVTLAANRTLTFTAGTGGVAVNSTVTNASKNVLAFTPIYTGGAADALTYTIIDVAAFAPTNAAGTDTVNGIAFGAFTDPGATVTSTGIKLGAGWDVAADFGGAPVQGVTTLTLANSETVDAAVDAQFRFTRNTAGTVTFIGADDAAAADTVYDTTGAGICTLGSADVTDTVLISAETRVRNGAAGNVLLGWQDFADTADDDQDHGQILVNCTDAGSGTEDCDLSVNIVEAGAAPETRLFFDADGDTRIGSATGGGFITLVDVTTGLEVRNNVTGSVIQTYRDYADTADDDMAHAQVTVNCTDVGTGAEDCDYTVGVVEAGAAAEERITIDADGGITIGSANNNSVTVQTDGTGDGEFEAPNDSINTDEITDGTIVAADLADTLCLQVVTATFNPTEAGATDDFVSLDAVDVATGDASFGAVEAAEDQFRVPVAVLADSLSVQVDVAPGAGNDAWTIVLNDDGGNTALTCTVDEAATTCTDAVAAVAIAAGSRLDMYVRSSGPGADPAAAAEMTISFCLGQ